MNLIYQIIIGLWILATLIFCGYCSYFYITSEPDKNTIQTQKGKFMHNVGKIFLIVSVSGIAIAYAIFLVLMGINFILNP